MNRDVYIEDKTGARRVEEAAFPLTIGGTEADITVLEEPSPAPFAYLGLSDGDIFVQPERGRVVCNGSPLSTSQWLRDGDVLRVGSFRIAVNANGRSLHLRIGKLEEKEDPPIAVPPSRTAGASSGKQIKPVAFTPKPVSELRRRRRGPRAASLVFWFAVALLGAAAWFVFTARSVTVAVEPAPDTVRVEGNFLSFRLGESFLLRPGRYRVIAEKEGYRRLERELEITEEPNQTFRFTMEKRPGLLAISTNPAEGAAVSIDGEEVGTTPLEPLELPSGEHQVTIRAERYRTYETTVLIEGEGTKATLDVELVPRWAPITFRSDPRGATLRVDGKSFGATPVTVDLLEGAHRYEILLSGHKPFQGSIEVVAGEARTLPEARLALADGRLSVASVPESANVTVDGVYQGQTPVEIALAPGEPHAIELSRAGYEPQARQVEIGPGGSETLMVELEPQFGEIEILVDPPDAELLVDGEPRGAAHQLLRLPATPHRIEVRKPGYESYATDVVPRPGFPQTIEVELRSTAEAKAASRPEILQTSQGHELRLIQPRRFEMGASRREPGRRANETLREVEITKPFYLATMEVTNRQFREFESGHRSGAVKGRNLEIDHHPVVRVTWEQAAAYCNWLSEKESLPPAYVDKGGKLVLSDPPTIGYRLPTEAEWALAARHPGGEALKYPWGSSLPVPPGSGNFADASARGLVPTTVDGYRDGFPTTAPADSFEPNALGIRNLGGNVAEWTNDFYTIYPSTTTGLMRDPVGPKEGEFHVIRGSSWIHGSITELRLSFRDYGNEPRPDVGFRIARYAE